MRTWVRDWARIHAPVSLYEKIVETAVSASGAFGEIVSVQGAGGAVTISTPNLTGLSAKMCFDFAVVNGDGAHTISIVDPSGRTINGQASLGIPSAPGAFAMLWFDILANAGAGAWVAFVGGGGGLGAAISYTVRGPIAPQAVTVTPTFVNNATIVTAPVGATQKLIITYSVEFQQTAGTQANATMSISVDTAGNVVDTYRQTLGNSGIDVNPEFNTVSWTLEINGDGLAHTYGLAVSVDVGGNTTIQSAKCRGVINVVDG
jgi:hypothetical protein